MKFIMIDFIVVVFMRGNFITSDVIMLTFITCNVQIIWWTIPKL